MSRILQTPTRASLLGRLQTRPEDPEVWTEFVSNYGPKVHAWCRRWGLQTADAEDVTQTVLLKLALKLRDFEYDPRRSFRAWLKTVTHHVWVDSTAANSRTIPPCDAGAHDRLNSVEARTSLSTYLEEAFDQELLSEAVGRVRLRVERRTWEAFRLLAEEGWSGADTAKHLQMKVATVFVARSKVQRMLRDEIERLEHGGQR